jgi:NarL family two-component system response regulator LiaR
MKVLIVEDNPNMQRMLTDFVGDRFEQIYQCNDGDEAFSLYEKHQPDWVLMDWKMPNKDGIKATREIIAEYPAAKICLVTSFADELLRKEAFDAGVKGFVLKRNLSELRGILT